MRNGMWPTGPAKRNDMSATLFVVIVMATTLLAIVFVVRDYRTYEKERAERIRVLHVRKDPQSRADSEEE